MDGRRPRRRKVQPDRPPIVLGYLRVSTDEQADSGAGMAAQRAAIEREAASRGWSDVSWIEDAGYSGKELRNRPGIQGAREALRDGRADVLVVSKLDRLTRSIEHFSVMLRESEEQRWSLVILEPDVDTTTVMGRGTAQFFGVVAEIERGLISQRTKAALTVKRAQGVRLGRPVQIPDDVHGRIMEARAAGMTYAAIADRLNAERVPTARGGGVWYASSVHAAVKAVR